MRDIEHKFGFGYVVRAQEQWAIHSLRGCTVVIIAGSAINLQCSIRLAKCLLKTLRLPMTDSFGPG
eukprot:c33312_g1_i1 orf=95-292(+)